MMRQVVLDTETTGLEPELGHRIIEIGCIEVVNRRRTGRRLHKYLCPDREIDAGALEVHGITAEFLQGQPRFADIAGELLEFISGAELIIHNAAFDVAFLDREFGSLQTESKTRVEQICAVLDTLALARRMHPGQRNGLDALCKRYGVDNSHRDLHGALLDAELLLDVYLAMTGGQSALSLDEGLAQASRSLAAPTQRPAGALIVRRAEPSEVAAHERFLDLLDKSSGGRTAWRLLEAGA
jgi:DNA polymerase-3 subunit epsilon